MRKGYWKTLLRRLRGRVASGADSFTLEQARLTLIDILASEDDALDPAAELPLARLGSGATLVIDTGSNLVLLRAADDVPCVSTGLDLPAFIDGLSAPDGGLALGEAELADLSVPRRPFLGD